MNTSNLDLRLSSNNGNGSSDKKQFPTDKKEAVQFCFVSLGIPVDRLYQITEGNLPSLHFTLWKEAAC